MDKYSYGLRETISKDTDEKSIGDNHATITCPLVQLLECICNFLQCRWCSWVKLLLNDVEGEDPIIVCISLRLEGVDVLIGDGHSPLYNGSQAHGNK
jgi:hypothetical protein